MKIHFTDLNKVNLDDLEKYLVRKGWKLLSKRYSSQTVKDGKIYSKNKHEILLINPSYSAYETCLSGAISALLCVEEIELPVKFKYFSEAIPFQNYLGVISGGDVQKLLTN